MLVLHAQVIERIKTIKEVSASASAAGRAARA